MDVSEYRRQVEAEAEAAARREPAFREILRNARPSGRAGEGAFESSTATGGDDLSIGLAVLLDSDANEEAFTAALQAMSLEVNDYPELIDTSLHTLTTLVIRPTGASPC